MESFPPGSEPGRSAHQLLDPAQRHNRKGRRHGEAIEVLLQMGHCRNHRRSCSHSGRGFWVSYYLLDQAQPSYLVIGGGIIRWSPPFCPAGRARLAWETTHPGDPLVARLCSPRSPRSLAAAIERTGGARDQANGERQAIAQRLELARTTVQDAKATADADEAKAEGRVPGPPRVRPRGPPARAEARAEASRQRVATARDAGKRRCRSS